MVRISSSPIDINALLEGVRDSGNGATVLFIGTVRVDKGPKGSVVALDYEAHDGLARQAMETIGAEMSAMGASGWAIAHRTGRVPAGEVSTAIAASSPHRGAAFDACRHAIERLKESAPIWKRTMFDTGESEWAEGRPLK